MRTKGPARREVQVLIKMSPDDRARFKVAAAEKRCGYAQFVMAAVERHERDQQRRAAVHSSPLHAGIEADDE